MFLLSLKIVIQIYILIHCKVLLNPLEAVLIRLIAYHISVSTYFYFQLMVVTHRGAAGVFVASHVTEELRLALVHAPIPRRPTEDEVAAN